MLSDRGAKAMSTATIRSSQKVFTEDEVSGITGICTQHLRELARSRNLGYTRHAAYAAQAMGDDAEKWYYTHSDLMVLAVLHPRCEHPSSS
jgi:hypothetical protein